MRLRHWRAKAYAQRLFSALPAGHRINYLFQRATHGLPIPDKDLDEAMGAARTHVASLERFGAVPVGEAHLFEFGAGWDLHLPLAMVALGVAHQTIVDIQSLLRPELVADAATRLGGRRAERWQPALPPTEAERVDLLGWLAGIGIDYRAPCDARDTGFPAASVDVATSTNTLEHIPPEEIRAILLELRRILRADGIASFSIDYQDHFSYFDRTISVYNYLRFTEREWRRYNSSLHFQNRLRHHQYLQTS